MPIRYRQIFARFSKRTADYSGHPAAFALACGLILAWVITGPYFDFSDGWQLVVNTGTNILTLLMVFLIQNAQNRDTRALQIKLDELIRVDERAHDALLDLEELSDDELQEICTRYQRLAAESRRRLARGESDTDVAAV